MAYVAPNTSNFYCIIAVKQNGSLKDDQHRNVKSSLCETDEEPVDKESDYYKRNLLPVDHGWAWAVCFGGFLVSFILGMSSQVMAILFVEVIEMFETNLTTGSLIFLFYIMGGGVMAPIATNIFAPKVGEKKVICIAGFIFALTSVGYSLSNTIQTFLLCAAVKGLCFGAMFVPSISLIRHYFYQRRSLAMNLGRAGASVSGILTPRLISLVKEELGVRRAFILVAAVELHIIVAGLLLRPVESYKFKPSPPPLKPQWPKKGKSGKDDTVAAVKDHDPLSQLNIEPILIYNVFSTSGESIGSTKEKLKEQDGTRNVSKTDTRKCLEEKQEGREGSSESLKKYTLLPGSYGESSVDPVTSCPTTLEVKRKVVSRTIWASRTFLAFPEESTVALDCYQEECWEEEQIAETEQRKFYHLWAFYMLLASAVFGGGNIYIRNYFPTIAVSQGATLDQAASLLSVIGVLDLLNALSVGLFADTHLLKPAQIVAISHICLGVVCHFVRVFTTFPLLIVMTIIIATFLGTRICMMPLVVMDVVGVDMMPQAFSIVTTVATFSVAAMNPSLGAVADHYEGFVPVLHIVGVLFFMSATILLLLPIGQRLDERRVAVPKRQ